jgi:hypothetical protein
MIPFIRNYTGEKDFRKNIQLMSVVNELLFQTI